jgi:hypothetical protein
LQNSAVGNSVVIVRKNFILLKIFISVFLINSLILFMFIFGPLLCLHLLYNLLLWVLLPILLIRRFNIWLFLPFLLLVSKSKKHLLISHWFDLVAYNHITNSLIDLYDVVNMMVSNIFRSLMVVLFILQQLVVKFFLY